jgi:hypothetical protein
MTATPSSQWCVRLNRARWVLSVDGEDLASASDPSELGRLAELAGATVDYSPAKFSSWEEDRALTEELRDAVAAHVGRLAGAGGESAGLGWLTGWLAAGYPDVAREALASLGATDPRRRSARPVRVSGAPAGGRRRSSS